MRRSTAALGSAVFFLLAPGTVIGLIPWLLTGWQVSTPLPYWLPLRVVGGLLLGAGLLVVAQAFVRFVVDGRGTPAPVAAPQDLVVCGPYRFVRNPMYVAVVAAINGQALVLGQLGLLFYGAVVWLAMASFVRWYEEPELARRFGAEYGVYQRAVPAWLPRLRPWERSEHAGDPARR